MLIFHNILMIRISTELASALEALAFSMGEQHPPILLTQEHTAIHENDLDAGIRHWERNGYYLLKQTDTVAFVMHPDPTKIIIELVKEPIVEHLAFRVTQINHLDEVLEYIKGHGKPLPSTGKPVFTVVEASLHLGEVKYLLIRHNRCDTHIQIIWRQQTLESLMPS